MPQAMTGLRIFLASSSDVNSERIALKKVVNSLSNRYVRFGLSLNVISWEDSIVPNFGLDPQDVVNRQIRFDLIDIFVGIVWRRIGTPTPRALSGTIEETNRALMAHTTTGRPWYIMFFLCDRPFKPKTSDEKNQLEEAQKFRDWVEKRSICKKYSDEFSFQESVQVSLSTAIDDFIRNQQFARLPQTPQPAPLILEPINFFSLRIWCPWCRNFGPLGIMANNLYAMYRGQTWPCPRCGGPQFFP